MKTELLTTAVISGGLAGLKCGYDGLPKDWLDNLRGKNKLLVC